MLLLSIPFPGIFRYLGRDLRTAGLEISTLFRQKPLFGQRFPDGGAWNLYLFPAKAAVWVEISGRRSLESLPFSRDFRYLGRDFRQVEIGFSTHFVGFPCFGQRFPDGGAWFLYPFPRFSLFQVENSGRWKLVSLPISSVSPVLGRDLRTAGLGFSTHFAGFPCFRQRFPVGGIWFLYPFRRFPLFQVEILGSRGLVSLPISSVFPVLGRDLRTAGLGISTLFRQKPLFGQRFPVSHPCYGIAPPQHTPPRHTSPRHTSPQHTLPRRTPPRHAPPQHTLPRHTPPRHRTPTAHPPRHTPPRRIPPRQPPATVTHHSAVSLLISLLYYIL